MEQKKLREQDNIEYETGMLTLTIACSATVGIVCFITGFILGYVYNIN